MSEPADLVLAYWRDHRDQLRQSENQLKPATLPLSALITIDAGHLPDNDRLLDQARTAHYGNYPRLRRIHLHHLWTGLHIGVALYGATLTIIVALP